MTEDEYMADPEAGIDPTGRKLGFAYAGRNCPMCGRALRYIVMEDPKGRPVRRTQRVQSRKRRSEDAVPVERWARASRHTMRLAGRDWVHTFVYECPACGLMTEGQASAPPQAPPRDPPPDYYADDPPPRQLQMGGDTEEGGAI